MSSVLSKFNLRKFTGINFLISARQFIRLERFVVLVGFTGRFTKPLQLSKILHNPIINSSLMWIILNMFLVASTDSTWLRKCKHLEHKSSPVFTTSLIAHQGQICADRTLWIQRSERYKSLSSTSAHKQITERAVVRLYFPLIFLLSQMKSRTT